MSLRLTNRVAKRQRTSAWSLAYVAFLLALVFFAPAAHAEFFQYSTTTTILNGFIPPSSVVTNNSTTAAKLTTPGNIGITFIGDASNSPGDNVDGTGLGSDIVYANLAVSGLNNTSLLEGVVIPFTFHIVVDDYATFSSVGALGSATFDITGQLSGSVGKAGGGKQVNLTTVTFSPSNVLSKVIGTELYTLSLFSYVPPGPTVQGAFGVHIVAGPVPEPSTLVLLSMATAVIAVPAIRKKLRR